MAMDDLMCFRLAYLQAIARTFEDPGFLELMIKAGDGGLAFLAQNFPNVPPPDWNIKVTFAKDTLLGNGYHPELTGTWVGPPAELTLCFPPAPDVAVQAEALAAYYAALPSPLGRNPTPLRAAANAAEGGGAPDLQKFEQTAAKALIELIGLLSQGGSAGPGGDGLGQGSDALVLGAVVVRALALSWRSTQFADQLFDPSRPVLETLENWLGYNCPWNIKLFATRAGGSYNAVKKAWAPAPANQLKFFVPNRPTDQKDYAIALAAYNQTGDAYPFTCP